MHKQAWLFDTVSLGNFLLIKAAYILETRYRGHGMITRQVHDELTSGFGEYPALKDVNKIMDGGTFQRISLSKEERKHYEGLIGHLGKGEASCIAVAKARSGIVVTDDRAARTTCHSLGVPVTGTLGILKAAVLAGQINAETADRHLLDMVKAGFYSPVDRISDII